jgi:hypothetical protein
MRMYSSQLRSGKVTNILQVLIFPAIALGCASESSGAASPNASSGGANAQEPSSGSTSVVPAAECSRRCVDKAIACRATSDQARKLCDQTCATGKLTAEQLQCLENKPCGALTGESIAQVCPAKAPSGVTTPPGTPGTSSPSAPGTGPVTGMPSGGSSGRNPMQTLPTELTITGQLASGTKAIHTGANNGKSISSFVSMIPAPTFRPSQPLELPKLFGSAANIKILYPDPGSCVSKVSVTLNSTQLGLSVLATDDLPSAACLDFTDKIAKSGFKGMLTDVPYPNSSVTATVTIEIK